MRINPSNTATEIRAVAESVLLSESLEEKLAPFPESLQDLDRGDPVRHSRPARPAHLLFDDRKRGARMPHPSAFHEGRLRAVAHHIMANHELQALEVMAWTLLAFPDAPPEFRKGLLRVMRDEQRHTKMHIRRLEAYGLKFGDKTLNGYVWKKAMRFASVMDYLAGLPLTFEGGNLDHTLAFADWFDRAGDSQGADVFRAIHEDEIDHVAFGLHWLRKLKAHGQADWDAYIAHLHWPLRPAYAKGNPFHRAAREKAGMSPEFIDALEQAQADWMSEPPGE